MIRRPLLLHNVQEDAIKFLLWCPSSRENTIQCSAPHVRKGFGTDSPTVCVLRQPESATAQDKVIVTIFIRFRHRCVTDLSAAVWTPSSRPQSECTLPNLISRTEYLKVTVLSPQANPYYVKPRVNDHQFGIKHYAGEVINNTYTHTQIQRVKPGWPSSLNE